MEFVFFLRIEGSTSRVEDKWLYSPRNDPDPEMIPNPEMIPTFLLVDPEMIPNPEMIPTFLLVDPEMIRKELGNGN